MCCLWILYQTLRVKHLFYVIMMSLRCEKKEEKDIQQTHFISGESLWENLHHSQDTCSATQLQHHFPLGQLQLHRHDANVVRNPFTVSSPVRPRAYTHTSTVPSQHKPQFVPLRLVQLTQWPLPAPQPGLTLLLRQNSSSALRQRDSLSRVRRASASATDSSPWTLLSLVRTLTLLVIFSFSPTTAKTRGDKQLEAESHNTTQHNTTQHNTHTHATHSYPNALLKLCSWIQQF